MHQHTEVYRGQFTPWDPCYVIPFACPIKLMIEQQGAKRFKELEQRRVQAAIYINAVIMGLGQD